VGVWRRTVRPSRVPPVGTGVRRRHERLTLLRRVTSGRTAAWTRTRARRWRAVERPAEGQCGETRGGVRRNGGDGTVGRSLDRSRRGPPVSVQSLDVSGIVTATPLPMQNRSRMRVRDPPDRPASRRLRSDRSSRERLHDGAGPEPASSGRGADAFPARPATEDSPPILAAKADAGSVVAVDEAATARWAVGHRDGRIRRQCGQNSS
jgi:hypothetical protein